jgi:cytochrome c-type biogenesis protein CcmF
MIPEIGQFSLALALMVALAQGSLPLLGAWRGVPGWVAVARPAAQAQFIFVGIAFASLAHLFLANDFSVLYVASHSNSSLPAHYRFAAVWGGHEGSMLLWLTILNLWTLAVSLFSRHLPEEMAARVLAVMGLLSAGFIGFLLFTSNPFERLIPAAVDGRDLNPLLQDPGMVLHPPMLYMGYVGFSVAFAFVIAALLAGRLDASWARWSRPWTTIAWSFLSVGIALGSWWAYYELGWGGWWFWDPVENASFLPWLVGTALMHSLAVTEKRGAFHGWTLLLAILAFSLSLLGTFLVRSGVLSSVHAFATDPKRGVYILVFLGIVIGGSLTLYAWRMPKVGLGGAFAWVSREAMLMANNVFLLAAMASVLLGTLYPLFLDALDLGKISVGPPYFNSVFVPLIVPVLFLMGIGPLARWKRSELPDLARRLRGSLVVSVLSAVAVPLLYGEWHALTGLGVFLAVWIGASGVVNLRERLRGARVSSIPLAFWGMLLAHTGMAACVLGVTLVKSFEQERDVRMNVGDTLQLAGYQFRFDGVTEVPGPNYQALRGSFQVSGKGKNFILAPEKRVYRSSRMPMTEAAIDTGFTRDLYVSLGEPLPNGGWSVRVYFKPFVDWIWAGFLLMGIGGAMAARDRRYRLARRQEMAAARLSTAGGRA